MVEGVGATILADSVISWAIGQGLTALARWAKLAVHCKSKCAALADLLEGQQLRAVARDLDSLTQADAFAQVRAQYDRLCEQLEEAQYVVLRCRQTGAWNVVTRVRMGRRIEAVHVALEATAQALSVHGPAALQQDTAIKQQLARDAQAARDRARLLVQGDPLPLQPERGAVGRAASRREPEPLQVVFQHLDALVPRLCAELANHRVHGIVGMAGLGKTTVAAAVYDRVKGKFQRHFFLTVGEQADVLRILRGIFKEVHPGIAVRQPSCTLLCAAGTCSTRLERSARLLRFLSVLSRACIQCSSKPYKRHSQSHVEAADMHNRTLQVPFEDDAGGCQWLASDLQTSKVLLVLDDVWSREHLRLLNFATMCGCRHQGSTLIVTTRDERVLHDDRGYQIDGLQVTRPNALSDKNAALLLCHHTFGSGHAPPAEFEGVVRDLVGECKGLPLALQTLGASVRGKGAQQWQELIERLQRIDPALPQTQQIMARCKPSYDALPPQLQQCFVDFAAYPEDTHVPANELIALWAARAPFMTPASFAAAEGQLAQLTQRILVIKDVFRGYYMHDILRDISVVEARESAECALAAGVAHVPKAMVARYKSATWQRIAGCMPRCVRRRIWSASGVKLVSLHSNSRAAECWERALPSVRMLYMQGAERRACRPRSRPSRRSACCRSLGSVICARFQRASASC
jgi:NB-ARC domain